MRSRPRVQLWLSPGEPCPGQTFECDVVLLSRSDTPCDGVSVELLGQRLVAGGRMLAVTPLVPTAAASAPAVETLLHAHAAHPAQRLPPGRHLFRSSYRIPPEAPPSYTGRFLRIQYLIRVRVRIPWWPDRVEDFV